MRSRIAVVTIVGIGWLGPLPATVGAAGGPSCPDFVTPAVVAPGANVSIQGEYTDWAKPGTVTATFTGPGGLTRTLTAINRPDGTYDVTTTFDRSQIGRWDVLMTIVESAGRNACRATFRVAGTALPGTATSVGGPQQPDAALPGTATSATASRPSGQAPTAVALVALLGTALFGAAAARRKVRRSLRRTAAGGKATR